MFETEIYRDAFGHMLRNKLNNNDRSILNLDKNPSPEFPLSGKMDATFAKYNPLRKLATVVTVEGDGTIITTTANGKAEIVEENQVFPESSDESRELRFKSYKIASLAKIKMAFVNDRHFNVEDYLATKFAKRFAVCEENLFINGTGIEEPLGIMNSGIAKANATALTYDEIVKLFFSLDKDLRANATWLMSDAMAIKLRLVKDSNCNPMFDGETIFNKEVIIVNSLDENIILFGDFSYLTIIVRKPLSVHVLTEKYIATGEFGYAGNERLDAKLTDVNAVKALVIHTEE